MEQIVNWSELFLNSFQHLLTGLLGAVPKILGAIVLLGIGILISRLIGVIIIKTLKLTRFEEWMRKLKVHDLFEKAQIKTSVTEIIARFAYWVILLIFLVGIAETLGWSAVSEKISLFINFLPKVFISLIIFIVGLYIASLVRQTIIAAFISFGLSFGKLVSNAFFYFLLLFVIVIALEQLGIDTTIITSNVLIIIGGVVLAFAISYGLASKEILNNFLASLYSKNNFQIGQKIVLEDGAIGEIVKMDNISVTLKTEEGKLIIPIKILINEKIRILETAPNPLGEILKRTVVDE
ncbi:MAG: hypothetical protein MUE81_24085 [Thermoflexibacter sp.]|jgi:hypothetical protein|nr:hypothetical protein [Thermoflexibacter sp.]